MSYTIDNSQDIMDTRDVLEHLQSLEDDTARMKWVAGWNLPGHLPDTPYEAFASWEDACKYLIDEMENTIDNLNPEGDDEDKKRVAQVYQRAIDQIKDADEAQGMLTVQAEDWIFCIEPNDDFEPELAEEYAHLTAFVEEIEGYCTMKDGETLIREDYFEDYAQELARDTCNMDAAEHWPFRHIDWEAAAEELKIDYTTADFDGVTYYFRTH